MAAIPERQTSGLPSFGTQMNFSGPVRGRARVDAPNGPSYHAAVAGRLAELTGATLVLPQGKGLIKRSMAGTETETGPARWVHMGYTTTAARYAQPPHNSADLPGAGAAPRVSVEARFFAFFA
jgi:hypothetical protein